MTKQMDYIPEEIVILAMRRCLGNIQMTAQELGCSRGQLLDYIAAHPAVREEKLQLKEALVDQAEDMLVDRMKNSDPLLMFFLRTQGKSRGYDQAPTAPPGTNVNVTINSRTLIAAMRNGLAGPTADDEVVEGELSEDDKNSQDSEGSSILQLPDRHVDAG